MTLLDRALNELLSLDGVDLGVQLADLLLVDGLMHVLLLPLLGHLVVVVVVHVLVNLLHTVV